MAVVDDEQIMRAEILYYCQERFFGQVVRVSSEAQKKFSQDVIFSFFRAFGLLMQDQLREAIEELELLKDKRDVSLCVLMALVYAHKKTPNPDQELIQQLDVLVKEERKTSAPVALYNAALLLWLLGDGDKARQYVKRMIKVSSGSREGMILKSWIELSSSNNIMNSGKYFDEALTEENGVFALMGKVQYCELSENYCGALETVNQLIVRFPVFLPALMKKMKLLLNLQDWEQALDTAHRLLQRDQNNLEALHMLALHSLCRGGDTDESVKQLSNLISNLNIQEMNNPELFYRMSLAFTRVCGRSEKILHLTRRMLERAIALASTKASLAIETGFLLGLMGFWEDAMKSYKTAMNLDNNCISALIGIIKCQLMEGHVEDAEHQLEFMVEIQKSSGKSAELLYLQALLAIKKCRDSDNVINLLNEAVEIHFEALRDVPLSVNYLEKLNPEFVLEIVKGYLALSSAEPAAVGQTPPPQLQHCTFALYKVMKVVPGLPEAIFLLARVYFLSGNMEASQNSLQHLLDQNPAHIDAHMLMAQTHLLQGNFSLSAQSLELCLSHNFEIREHPLYHLLMAQAQKKMGHLQEAIHTLKTAMSLSSIRKDGSASRIQSKALDLSLADCVSIFLELAKAYWLNGEKHEAAKVMQDAINEFKGTPEEVRITIANAELVVKSGDMELALSMLRNITPQQPFYTQAKEKMADIYLNYRKDKQLYISCYRDMVEKVPSSHTFLLLGNAFMNIQQPELAVELYELAFKKNPSDGALASKIGKVLVEMHSFRKAINYYKAALKGGQKNFLRYDLASLLMKLRMYQHCEHVLEEALAHDPVMDLQMLIEDCRYLVLLAKVQSKVDKSTEALESLHRANELQMKVLKRVILEQPDAVSVQKQRAAEICSDMAELYISQCDYQQALDFYKEALTYCDSNSQVMLGLARLYLTMKDMEACQQLCCKILRKDPVNEAAILIMADLMYQIEDYDQSMLQFLQLLEKKPENYLMLSHLIDLLRRVGKLEEVPRFFHAADKHSPKAKFEPGFNYCKGLYLWYTGEPINALRHFNKARKDNNWGQKAVSNMIKICLNPDNETIGGTVFDNLDEDMGFMSEKQELEKLALSTALKLLKELKPQTLDGLVQLKILENYCHLATKHKAGVERALEAFIQITNTEKNNIPAILAMATAYMILQQTQRAQNLLKNIARSRWNITDADELEKSWLLLADIYVQSSRYDNATTLLKKILHYNKSCCKAYEYMGYIMEKQLVFKEATVNYEKAWKIGNQVNPTIGYRLAFNYLKDKRHVDAIDVCHKVLDTHPNFPLIRKDILDKARASIKP